LECKKHLAWLICAQYHGEEAADRAAAAWDRHVAGEDPIDIPEIEVPADTLDDEGRIAAPNLLKAMGFAESTSQARALIKQGAVNIGPDRVKITDPNTILVFKKEALG
jgi:tyrosyl-tRNA synthetase